MVRAWWLDLGIDCGCFGVGQAVSPGTLLRDGALALVSLGVTGAVALAARPVGAGVAADLRVPARWARTGASFASPEWRQDNRAGICWFLGVFAALAVVAIGVSALLG